MQRWRILIPQKYQSKNKNRKSWSLLNRFLINGSKKTRRRKRSFKEQLNEYIPNMWNSMNFKVKKRSVRHYVSQHRGKTDIYYVNKEIGKW
jgi:hypothetical protein